MKSIRAVDIENNNAEIVGKSGLPLGTVFNGKLKIVKNAAGQSTVQVLVPTLHRTINFDEGRIKFYSLDARGRGISDYDGKDIVAYEYIAFSHYPLDFWPNREPLVAYPKDRIEGVTVELMVRHPVLRPGRVLP